MDRETTGNTSAKVLYRPVGLTASIIGGVVAGQIFQQLWKRAARGENADPPRPLESEYGLRQILIAAAIQGAIFAVVRALMNRGGARLFQKWTGEWPGD